LGGAQHRGLLGALSPLQGICRESLAATFEALGIKGRAETISHYFDAFRNFQLYPDVIDTLDRLSRRFKLAAVSNIVTMISSQPHR